jgi:uncharacterized protein DUF955
VTEAAWERARAAEAAAREQLAAVPGWLWDGTSLPVPVETIADSHYGLLVEEAHDLRARLGVSGHAHLSGLLLPAERLIMVDAEEASRAPGRRRFTITHELGHWVMHCTAASHEPVYCRDVSVREDSPTALLDYPPPELEANQFAAAMLMPRELLLGQPHPTSVEEEYELARVFGVSREALRRRLWSLEQDL